MSSLPEALGEILIHHEDSPTITRPRHPIVVLCHSPYALLLGLVYWTFAHATLGQTLYFTVTVGLYISSTAYHALRPERLLRFIDQVMIGAYILVLPIPFLYKYPSMITIYFICIAVLAIYKWNEKESEWKIGAWVFAGLGVVSATLVIGFGLPEASESFFSWTGFWLVVAIGFFICKLIIYRFEIIWLPKIWESPELGHFVLSIAVSIYTTLVLVHPVV